MKYYLSPDAALKWLEDYAVYDIRRDELYELDEDAFSFLKRCSDDEGCTANVDAGFIEYCLSEGILVTEKTVVRRPPVIKSHTPSLRYLELQITDRCNLRCRHCYIDNSLNRELSLSDISRILSDFEEMQGLRLLITGGEPLMHTEFRAVNSLLSGFGFRKIVFTNGMLLNKHMLKELNVEEIQFSVDGMEHGHDMLRGKGSYAIVMRKVNEALDAGICVSIATMVHSGNTGEFDEMNELFMGLNIKDWTVDVPCITANLKDNPDLSLPPDIAGRYLNYGFGDGLHGSSAGYACGLHLMSVTASGDACKCAFYRNSPRGHVKEGLKKVWQRIVPVSLDQLECSDVRCQFMDTCRGGCRYRAETMWGEQKRDLYKCYSYGIIENKGMKP